MRLSMVAAVILCASQAFASMTWTTPGTRVSMVTSTTGSESSPSLVTEGLSLVGLATVQVCVEPAVGSSLTAGTLYAYMWNPGSSGPDGGYSGFWQRAPDLDLTVAASAAAGLGSCFIGINVKSNSTRIAYVPNGLGVANMIWIHGFK